MQRMKEDPGSFFTPNDEYFQISNKSNKELYVPLRTALSLTIVQENAVVTDGKYDPPESVFQFNAHKNPDCHKLDCMGALLHLLKRMQVVDIGPDVYEEINCRRDSMRCIAMRRPSSFAPDSDVKDFEEYKWFIFTKPHQLEQLNNSLCVENK